MNIEAVIQKIERNYNCIVAMASVIADYETLHAHVAVMIGSQSAAHHVLARLQETGLAHFE